MTNLRCGCAGLDEILARDLQCGFDGFRTAAGQPHLGERSGRAVHQIVGQPFRGLGREKPRVREGELIGLLADRLAHGFIAVAETRHRGAGRGIDIALARRIDEIRTVARDRHRQRVALVFPIQNVRHDSPLIRDQDDNIPPARGFRPVESGTNSGRCDKPRRTSLREKCSRRGSRRRPPAPTRSNRACACRPSRAAG